MKDILIDLMNLVVPFDFGSLWWGSDELIGKRIRQFTPSKIGHPLLSLRRAKIEDRSAEFPMFFGTSGTHTRKSVLRESVAVVGLTKEELEHVTYFGTVLEPGFFRFEDVLDGVQAKPDPKRDRNEGLTPWHKLRCMCPNDEKPRLLPSEMDNLEAFCKRNHIFEDQ